jgi:DNA (cytosine-5)-methyltransferase 1
LLRIKRILNNKDTIHIPIMNNQTVSQLRLLCSHQGIKVPSKAKKADLIWLLSEQTPPIPTILVQNPTPILRMIDLFAGTGAFSYAFHSVTTNTNTTDTNANTNTNINNATNANSPLVTSVFANDMVPTSEQIYNLNEFGTQLTLGNINDLVVDDIPAHDLLTGGFPCQPFSVAGRQLGFDDVRSNVFWTILRILDAKRPTYIVLENVKNLVSHDGGKTFATILQQLQQRGYRIKHKVLNTAAITGVPQHRERIYIVGTLNESVYDRLSLDFPQQPKRPISEFLEPHELVPDKCYYGPDQSPWPLLQASVTEPNTIYQYRRVYVRQNKSGECPTLTANMGTGGHNVPIVLDARGIRKLTPRECFNLQGFPATYRLPNVADSHLYKLAGNAVSVPVVQLIARRLLDLHREWVGH